MELCESWHGRNRRPVSTPLADRMARALAAGTVASMARRVRDRCAEISDIVGQGKIARYGLPFCLTAGIENLWVGNRLVLWSGARFAPRAGAVDELRCDVCGARTLVFMNGVPFAEIAGPLWQRLAEAEARQFLRALCDQRM
jgi:hypothetical protein